jgi:hypothetical protein
MPHVVILTLSASSLIEYQQLSLAAGKAGDNSSTRSSSSSSSNNSSISFASVHALDKCAMRISALLRRQGGVLASLGTHQLQVKDDLLSKQTRRQYRKMKKRLQSSMAISSQSFITTSSTLLQMSPFIAASDRLSELSSSAMSPTAGSLVDIGEVVDSSANLILQNRANLLAKYGIPIMMVLLPRSRESPSADDCIDILVQTILSYIYIAILHILCI